MNVTKFVFKTHKWLAVSTAVLTFLWFFSAIFMTMPAFIERAVAEPAVASENVDLYRDLQLSVPQAIAALEQNLGHAVRVNDVLFKKIQDKLYYRFGTNEGIHLVSGTDGSLLKITEDVARAIVVHRGARAEDLQPPQLLERYDGLYTHGEIPAWKFHDTRTNTTYFVEVRNGDTRSMGRMSRIKAHLVGWHTLEFLNPYMSHNKIRFIMWVFTVAGNAMFVFGMWILWIQFKNWRARRRAA